MGTKDWTGYEDWLATVPTPITVEEIWQFFGYRKALFFYDVCWIDCEELLKHSLGQAVARQLIRSAGSISANIEEGSGRGFTQDRLRFLRIALGSARESKGWYYRAKNLLKPEVLEHRLSLISEIVALLITEIQTSKAKLR
jgi:four helix bundle protein